MIQSSPFRFGQNRFTPSNIQFKSVLRGVGAIGLVALLFLAPLSFRISAQQPDSPKSFSSRDHFIFYQNAAGEMVCRDATPEEQREMDKINPKGLRQINHLPTDSQLSTNAVTGDNALPTHLTIILRATAQLEANAPAKAAFIRATQAWENAIKSPITIYLDADFGTTFFGDTWDDPAVLGATSSPSVNGVIYENVRRRLIAGKSNNNELAAYNLLPQNSFPIDVSPGSAATMTVSSSIARAIGLLQPTSDSTDAAARIGFNTSPPNRVFDFDRSDGINGFDFEAIATHEIGHALGFTSRSGSSSNTVPAVWDLFRFRTGTTAATFPSANRIMTIGGPTGNSNQFYFFPIPGDSELGLSTGGPSGVTTNNGDGNQSSHWKSLIVPIGIMAPTIGQGVQRDIGPNDLKAINSFGYNLETADAPPPSPPAPPVPANNDFVNAQILATTSCAGSLAGTNVKATKEPSELNHSPDGKAGGNSVWYKWTAPTTGSVTMTTDGSDYDTVLAVYTGDNVSSLALIQNNDDVDPGVITSSTVTFAATAGTVYKIAVDGWGGDIGNLVLNWMQGCTPTTAQLSASSYLVPENAGSLQISVNRGSSAGAATVTYATNDSAGLVNCSITLGDASERCDYQTTVGTLRFANGESVKSFLIPIIDDAHNEGNETFTVSLKSSSGAILDTPVRAVVTIVDEGSPTQNPFDNNQFFVTMQYIDFLGRLPDPDGLNSWLSVLNGCPNNGFGNDNPSCDRVHVSSGFFLSDEFRGRGYWAYRFYEVAFNRRPTYAEFVPDMAQVGGPQSPQSEELSKAAYKDEFVQRGEFTSQYNGLSNAAFVNAIEANAEVNLDNAALTAQLDSGKSRAQLLREIVESKPVEDQFFIRAFVAMQYFGYLRRDPDTNGYNDWVTTLSSNPSDFRHMIFGFIYSNEYRTRFGQ